MKIGVALLRRVSPLLPDVLDKCKHSGMCLYKLAVPVHTAYTLG